MGFPGAGIAEHDDWVAGVEVVPSGEGGDGGWVDLLFDRFAWSASRVWCWRIPGSRSSLLAASIAAAAAVSLVFIVRSFGEVGRIDGLLGWVGRTG